MNQREIENNGKICVSLKEPSNIDVNHEEGFNAFAFDRVFGMTSTQVQVFEEVAVPLVNDVLDGYNATIFAYGQTGTGKSHTMEGIIHDEDLKGIIPRSVEGLFKGVEYAESHIEFTFKVSYIEIYMEKIRDLLDMTRVKSNLTVREEKGKGTYIADVTEEYVASHEELLGIMARGGTNRAVAATGMNEGSSRSHSVFTITVTQTDTVTRSTKSGKLQLIDLAGSEMVKKTNVSGQQLEEAKTINKSLSALGLVINALTEGNVHVPYRDSKLTRILQDSLGGNAKTALIVAISPSSYNASESISTLRFGMRAKSIENKVTVNQTRSVEELEALLLRAEKAIDTQTNHILALQAQIQAVAAGGGVDLSLLGKGGAGQPSTLMAQMQEKLTQLTHELEDEKNENTRKDAELTDISALLREKDRLLTEASDLLLEAQKHYESQRKRSDELSKERVENVKLIDELKAQLDDALQKHSFDTNELNVTIESLHLEKDHLKAEIAELGGETGTDGRKPRDNAQASSGRSGGASVEDARGSAIRSSCGNIDDSAIINIDTSACIIITKIREERTALVARQAAELKHLGLRFLPGDETASDEYNSWFRAFLGTLELQLSGLEKKYMHVERAYVDAAKKTHHVEMQRLRLERDLTMKCENNFQLMEKLDAATLGTADAAEMGLVEQRNKSMQQRLEQLVVVHRQLLRKFGSLELENTELRKKNHLRDERIKQLEINAKGMTGSLRSQTERHITELASLRDQVEVLKLTPRASSQPSQSSVSPGPHSVKSLRGGGGGDAQVKAVRGGGSGARPQSMQVQPSLAHQASMTQNRPISFYPLKPIASSESGPRANLPPAPVPATSLFSRLMGSS